MPETALVTGGAGFIGSHLSAALLGANRRVVALDNFDGFYDRRVKLANLQRVDQVSRAPGATFEVVEADIVDRDRIRAILQQHRPSCVFHIAALAGVRPSIENPARYGRVNLDGLVSVLDAARECGCRNVIFASSSSVYGNNYKVPFAETDPVDEPISPYAATKRAGELICHTYAHLFGMRIAALRFFTVFGPAQRPDLAISTFMRLIADGEEVPMFGDGSTSRDYTYIDDIIGGVLAAERIIKTRAADSEVKVGEAGGAFRIWNLGGSQPHTLAEMIDVIARTVGKPARIRQLAMQPGDVERTWADLTRSTAELGFQPKTTFEDGVRNQWDWLRTSKRGEPAPAIIT